MSREDLGKSLENLVGLGRECTAIANTSNGIFDAPSEVDVAEVAAYDSRRGRIFASRQRFATCCTKCSFSFKFLVDSVVLCSEFDALFELIEFDFLEYDNVKIFAVKIIPVNFANKI